MKTYTIATASDMMIAIVPDGQDIAAEVSRTADEAGVTFDSFGTISGLTLTDEPAENDRIVVYGDKMGRITDEDGIGYRFAVVREAPLACFRRSDEALTLEFGSRADYLATLTETLSSARSRLAGGFAADNARMTSADKEFFDAHFGQEDESAWVEQRQSLITSLERYLAANAILSN
jgi:hypothetical protein